MKRYVVQRELEPSSQAFIEGNTETLGEFDELEPAKALLLVMCPDWRVIQPGISGLLLLTSGLTNTRMTRWARVAETSDPWQLKADT